MDDTSTLTEKDLQALLYASGAVRPARVALDDEGRAWLLFEWPLRHATAEFLEFSLECVVERIGVFYVDLPHLTDAGRARIAG